jgi:K+/H+ antiporter YhaU regulatory subunit KhtT
MVFHPSSKERIEAGDRLVVLADSPRLKEAERLVSR